MMKLKWHVSLTIISFIFTYCQSVSALTPGDRDYIQNQQQQRLVDDQQQRNTLWDAFSPQRSSTTISSPSESCFFIHKIDIHNTTLISSKQQQRLLSPWINRCLNIAKINDVVHEISDWYIQRGYITSRAFLTEQDLSTGALSITVLEGKLEAIRLEGESATMLRFTFPGLAGKILNLRDIEQGMEQINRLRSEPVQIEIQPSSQVGYSVVNLTAKPEFPLNAALGWDNSGQKSTGTGQLTASLTGNNLLGLADRWFISGGRSSAFSDWRESQNIQASVSVPYGYGLLDYSYSASNYHSNFINNSYTWLSNGNSTSHRLNGSWILFRNGDIKTALQMGVSRYSTHNSLNQVMLQTASRKLTSVQLGLNHTQKILGGVATLNPALSRGMPWLDAETDSGKRAELPKAQFRKWSASGSFQRPLSSKTAWLSSLYAQWSPDHLYGNERLTLGGESSVRGFKEQYLSGDIGGYLRNEINYSLFTLPAVGEVSAVVALDGGWIKSDKQNRAATGSLWGSAIGLSTRNRYFYTQYTLGIPLSYPGYLQPDHVSIYARIGLVF